MKSARRRSREYALQGLYAWLLSGDPATVLQAGISVAGRAVSERSAGPLEHHVVDWPGRTPRPRKPRN